MNTAKQNTYTVIGMYTDNDQRFAESYRARTPEEAEGLAISAHPDLLVAGVVLGNCKVVA